MKNSSVHRLNMMGGNLILTELLESEAFCAGIAVGIGLYQEKVMERTYKNW